MNLRNFLPSWLGGKQEVALGQPDTFFKFVGNNATDLHIEATGDRVGDAIRYQWKDHGPFTISKDTAYPLNTVVKMSESLEAEFNAGIRAQYDSYLAPWVGGNIPIPTVSYLLTKSA